MAFRFDVGEQVRVVSHPQRPLAVVTGRRDAAEAGDVHEENVYAVSGFVTQQRESSLARDGFAAISLDPLTGWQMAGAGGFRRVGPGTVESDGGPGVLWYTGEEFDDFTLIIDFRLSMPEDNAGVFVRIPWLAAGDRAESWKPAAEQGYEIQIDDRGMDHQAGVVESAWHRTGAIYERAPARARASGLVGQWNTFEIDAQGATIRVGLNGIPVSALTDGPGGRRRGYIGLQNHHPGARVRFRSLHVKRLSTALEPAGAA